MQMYRRLIVGAVALATVLTAAPAFAQNQPNTGLGFGVHFGGNWTSIRTEENEFDIDSSAGAGWLAGIWFGGNRDGRVGLMGELSYLKSKVKFTDFEDEIASETTYLQIPVLLRINAGSRSRAGASVYFLVGPAFDIQLDSDDEFTDLFTDADDVYEGLNIGIMFGAGFEVARLGVEVRYNYGVRSVLGTDAAIESGFGSVKTNQVQLVGKIRIN
jgi:hypothetical protein